MKQGQDTRKEFERWAVSEGRSIKPASEYSPQVYASSPSNNALDGWQARQPEIESLKGRLHGYVEAFRREEKRADGAEREINALISERDELLNALRIMRKLAGEYWMEEQIKYVDPILAKYPEK